MHCAVKVGAVSVLCVDRGLEAPVSHPGPVLIVDSEHAGHMVGI